MVVKIVSLMIFYLQRVFENPYYFYNHVGDHVESQYDSHMPEEGCLCLWDGNVLLYLLINENYLNVKNE